VDALEQCAAGGIGACQPPGYCGAEVVDDRAFADDGVSIVPRPYVALRSRIKAGPPPVTYQPPMPPKFLPVPARPVFANVNPAAPLATRGEVEVDFGAQLAVPGRD